jgi:hypothetical protein
MQPLEFAVKTPTAKEPLELNGATVNQTRGDCEFGRFMDQALPPPTQDETKTPPEKNKPASTAKPHASKLAVATKATGDILPDSKLSEVTSPKSQPSKIIGEVKTPTKAAGEKSVTDLISPLPPEIADEITPSPIFLTLPIGTQFNGGNAELMPTETVTLGNVEAANAATRSQTTDQNAGASPAIQVPTQPVVATPPTLPENIPSVITSTAADLLASNSGLKTSDSNPLAAQLTAKISPAAIPTTPTVITPRGNKTERPTREAGTSALPGLETISPTDWKLPVPVPQPTAAPAPTNDFAENSPDTATLDGDATPEKVLAAPATFYEAMRASNSPSPVAAGMGGTGVATDAVAMKNSENVNKAAGLDAKVLPGGKVGRAAADSTPQLATVPVRAQENPSSDLNLSVAMGSAVGAAITESASVIALPSLTDAHLRSVERTQEMVVMHALRLAKSDTESLSVVIRPGGGAELSLELRQRNGAVEAIATLQHGDFQMLNQHWPELQEKLDQRGIKLAALGGEANGFSFSGNENSSRQNSAREEQTQRAAAFAEFTVAMNRGGATARYSPPVNGNEWWA